MVDMVVAATSHLSRLKENYSYNSCAKATTLLGLEVMRRVVGERVEVRWTRFGVGPGEGSEIYLECITSDQ